MDGLACGGDEGGILCGLTNNFNSICKIVIKLIRRPKYACMCVCMRACFVVRAFACLSCLHSPLVVVFRGTRVQTQSPKYLL